jgi:hypothetical protein
VDAKHCQAHPILVGGPREAQGLAPMEVGPNQDEITLAIGGTTYIWTRDELIDGTGPVVEQLFRLMAMTQYRDAEALARLDNQIARLDGEINRLDAEIGRLNAQLANPSSDAEPSIRSLGSIASPSGVSRN